MGFYPSSCRMLKSGNENDKIFIPIDTTPKSGSNYCENLGLKFDKAADFVLVINGKDNSRLMVQERYEVLRSTYSQNLKGFDTYLVDNVPDKNSSKFVNIDMILEIFNITEDQQRSKIFNFGEPAFDEMLNSDTVISLISVSLHLKPES